MKSRNTTRRIDTRSFPWIVDEKHRGAIDLDMTCVVMNRTVDSKLHRSKVSYFVTAKPGLFAGNNTVAIFRIKSFTPQFKAFFNQNHSNMHMDPNTQVAENEESKAEETAETSEATASPDVAEAPAEEAAGE